MSKFASYFEWSTAISTYSQSLKSWLSQPEGLYSHRICFKEFCLNFTKQNMSRVDVPSSRGFWKLYAYCTTNQVTIVTSGDTGYDFRMWVYSVYWTKWNCQERPCLTLITFVAPRVDEATHCSHSLAPCWWGTDLGTHITGCKPREGW